MRFTALLPFAILLGVLFCLSASGQLIRSRPPGRPAGTPGNVSKYDKIYEYSNSLYDNDIDFRESVEAEFRELQRHHLVIAAEQNSSAVTRQALLNSSSIYPNPQVQDLVGMVGRRMTDGATGENYVFRVLLDPLPSTEALSTGTIYITAGILSLVRNESQLAWLLAHEISHVRHSDWKQKLVIELGLQHYQAIQTAKIANSASMAGLMGGGLGGAIGSATSPLPYRALSELRNPSGLVQSLEIPAYPNRRATADDFRHQYARAEQFDNWTMSQPLGVEWSRQQEDAADADAYNLMKRLGYDVKEVQMFLETLDRIANTDPRVRLSYFGAKKQLEERLAWFNSRISTESGNNNVPAAPAALSVEEFGRAIAVVNRDSGILAFRSDMLGMARETLKFARETFLDWDPAVHYYYGRTLQALAEDEAQRGKAADELRRATLYDRYGQFYDAELHRAVLLLDSPNRDNNAISLALQNYVDGYVEAHRFEDRSRWLPPDIGWIQNYMITSGERAWVPKFPEPIGNEQTSRQAVAAAPAPAASAPPPVKAAKPMIPGIRK